MVDRSGDMARTLSDSGMTPDAVREMIVALEAAAVDDSVRAVSLSSSGPDFCAGADVVASNRGDGPKPRVGNLQRRTALQAHRLVEVLTTIQLPVVCTVRGWAAGLGCQLALASDFTIASDTSITVTVPAGTTTGTVTVTVPWGTLHSSGAFTVLP